MTGISNRYIESILFPSCKYFKGVFSANSIPGFLTNCETFSIVCNLSRIEEEGSHFISIIASSSHVLYIDSLGLPCIIPEISSFLQKLSRPVFYNVTRVQDLSSKFCGFFCILFVLHSERKCKFSLKFEETNLLKNDHICIDYIQQLLK
jgi:hypothetical protein